MVDRSPMALVDRMMAARSEFRAPEPIPQTYPVGPGVGLAPGVPLPSRARAESGHSLDDVIARRRSGGLTRGNLDPACLGGVLGGTNVSDDVWPDGTPQPVLFPILHRVPGFARGVYRYVSTSHSLSGVASIESEQVWANAISQEEHRSAAALIVLAIPLAHWLTMHGDYGYRAAALTAGWVVDQFYLAAETEALTYSATGAFAPALLDGMIGLDGYYWTSFFAFALGGERGAFLASLGWIDPS